MKYDYGMATLSSMKHISWGAKHEMISGAIYSRG